MTLESAPLVQLFSLPIHAVTMEQTLSICHDAARLHRPLVIGVVNAAKIVNMRRQPLLRESVASSDLVLADGMAIVWAGRVLGQRLPERVTGIDLFQNLLALADRETLSVYFLGAKQEVLDEMIRRVRDRHPNLRIAGSRNGYFTDEQSTEVAEQIRRSRCDMLFLGMSSPKKEIFLGRWARTLEVSVCHGVGGSFDVLAGKVKRAPRFWQKLGMEWFYRVLQEPRRMWKRYLVTNVLFVMMLLKHRLRGPRAQGS